MSWSVSWHIRTADQIQLTTHQMKYLTDSNERVSYSKGFLISSMVIFDI